MKNEYLLPGAVVIGAGLIGAGLYFGLRARPAEAPPPAPLPASARAAPPPVSAPAAAAPPMPVIPGMGFTPPAVPADVLAKAEADAREALARNKEDVLVPKCWAPSLKASPDPPRVELKLSLSFGPDGAEIGRGLHETRGAARGDVTACVQNQPMTLRISPPGVPVNLLLPLEFP